MAIKLWATLLMKEMKNLTNFVNYMELQPAAIELDPEDENLENRMAAITEKVDKVKVVNLRINNSYNDCTEDQRHCFCII
jgi:hypothetical protein